MKLQHQPRLWYLYSLPLILMSSLACALLSQPTADLPPSRTPLPTFTVTSPADDVLEIATPTPADTPTPPPPAEPTPVPPTASPPPPAAEEEGAEADDASQEDATTEDGGEEPEATEPSEAEPTEAEAPGVEPTPQVAPTSPPPTEAPPAEPAVGAHGVRGQISFREGRNTYGVGEKVFVKIEATNTEPGQKPFGILGLTTSTGAFQTSWSSGTIDGTFTHEDGLAFSSPGNHKMWLSICFSTEQVCQGADGEWERFEPGLDVVIQ